MQLFFKTLIGSTLAIDIDHDDVTVLEVKQKLLQQIQNSFKTVDDFDIVICGKLLANKDILREFFDKNNLGAVDQLSTLHLVRAKRLTEVDYPYGNHFSLEFRQFLSETTQSARHQQGHISTAVYWNQLDKTERQGLLDQFSEQRNVPLVSQTSAVTCNIL